jgi:hypothetical protein
MVRRDKIWKQEMSSKSLLALYRDVNFGLGERPNTKRSLY